MADATVEDLIARETQLTRSFAGFVVAWAAGWAWPMFMASKFEERDAATAAIWLLLLFVQLLLRGWYAYAAAMAAKALGGTGWHYAVWIFLAPVLSYLPIPLVSMAIAASPLSIKFLLGNQLQAAIRDQGMASLHDSPRETAPPPLPAGRLEAGP